MSRLIPDLWLAQAELLEQVRNEDRNVGAMRPHSFNSGECVSNEKRVKNYTHSDDKINAIWFFARLRCYGWLVAFNAKMVERVGVWGMQTEMRPLALVLARVKRARRIGKGYTAQCPVFEHSDRQPSLSIGQAEDGKVLLKWPCGL
jgi:hypothetical protein